MPLFNTPPNVTATVFSNESPGPAFAIYSIQINALQVASLTQIVFDAQNVNPENEANYAYVCGYVVIGNLRTATGK